MILDDLTPMPPSEGPPLPRGLGLRWPGARKVKVKRLTAGDLIGRPQWSLEQVRLGLATMPTPKQWEAQDRAAERQEKLDEKA